MGTPDPATKKFELQNTWLVWWVVELGWGLLTVGRLVAWSIMSTGPHVKALGSLMSTSQSISPTMKYEPSICMISTMLLIIIQDRSTRRSDQPYEWARGAGGIPLGELYWVWHVRLKSDDNLWRRRSNHDATKIFLIGVGTAHQGIMHLVNNRGMYIRTSFDRVRRDH